MVSTVIRRSSATRVAIDFLVEIRRILRHPIASDAGLLSASQYAATALSFLTAAVAARLLGPVEYGVAALVMAYPTLVWSFVATKSVSVTTRYTAGFHASGRTDELRSVCKLGYGLDCLASVTAFILISGSGWWAARSLYSMSDISWLMVSYAASFPFFSLTGTSWAILSSLQRFHWLAIFQILDKGITFVVVLSFLLAGFGMAGMVLGTAIGHATIGLMMAGAATHVLYRDGVGFWFNASLRNMSPLQKELTAFFGWNYITVTLGGLMGQVPLMLLGGLRGPQEAGFYRLAMSLMTAGSYLETSLGRVVYPILSARWGAGERESLDGTLNRWTLRGGLPIGVLVLVTIPLLPVLLPVVFGSDYSPMVFGAQVMMVGAAASVALFWVPSFYYASARIGTWTRAYALYTASVIALGWFCIQQWGFLGLAILTALGKVVFILSMGFFLRPRGKEHGDSSCLSPSR